MAKRGFDLGALARAAMEVPPQNSVSELDTGRQLQYIPLDLLDPDPRNFYSTDGLEALAGNIEMNGLQQPLLVRPAEGGRYTVVSGHRRREALRMIRDGGGRSFEAGVPCIVDESEGSEALQELRLIMANLDTRKMTSADQSRQAERIEDLLRQLVDEGYEFPGRLRDWVAELSGMSRTKLARLHAIRQNLEPGLLAMFDDGTLNESVAYELSKYDHQKQLRIAFCEEAGCPDDPSGLTADLVRRIAEADEYSPDEEADGWDPEAYLAERQAEDDDFFRCLTSVSDRFLRELGAVNTRQEGIETLKRLHRNRGGTSGDIYIDGSGRGLTLTRPGFKALRTWTEVYDMLCTIALSRAAARRPDTAPAGLEWHDADTGDMPEDDRNLVCFGKSGLTIPRGVAYAHAYRVMPEVFRWWATADVPEVDS